METSFLPNYSISKIELAYLYLIFSFIPIQMQLFIFIINLTSKNNVVSFISFMFARINQLLRIMELINDLKTPSKDERMTAMQSYNALAAILNKLQTKNPEIEIEETKEKIKIPLNILKLLANILKVTSEGKPISIIPIATEMTTQAAAEFLGCSRPHLVKLLEEGHISFTKIGRHRRVKFEDVAEYKKYIKQIQKRALIDIIKSDEELGIYDS